ncbi:MAG: hypothetical protein LAQ69_31430 [Acidobacteriia bacterium]|nr:hypothetical protein [Terriglobia bacterium]
MDYTIANNAKLFDDLLQVLNKHENREAHDYLKAARVNYVQRSIDHMLNCLALAVHDLVVVHPPDEVLQRDLGEVFTRFFREISRAGPRFVELAREYEASGGKPLSHDEIMEEVNDRRGSSR